jgi:hypothetical protein
MDTMTCPACGAQIEAGARYCRKCGNASALEAETREFDRAPQAVASTQRMSPTTAPELINIPGNTQPPIPMVPAPPSDQRRTIIILASLVGFLMLVLVAGGLAYFIIRQPGPPFLPPPPPGGDVAGPAVPRPPGHPGLDVPPPARPPAPGDPLLQDLLYPGATFVFKAEDSNKFHYQLRSDDPPARVRDWYKFKLKEAAEVISMADGPTILNAGEVKVILTADHGGTVIMLTRDR